MNESWVFDGSTTWPQFHIELIFAVFHVEFIVVVGLV